MTDISDGYAESTFNQLQTIGTACGIDPEADLAGIMTWAEFVDGETYSLSDIQDLRDAIVQAILEHLEIQQSHINEFLGTASS